MRFEVQVTPRASRTQLAGVHDEALKVALAAPPVDGAANAALLRVLAKALGVPRGALSVVAGARARRKTLEAPAEAEPALRALC